MQLEILFTVFSLHNELSPACRLKWPGHNDVQIMYNTSGTYRVQHDKGTAQLLRFYRVEITFILALKEGRKLEYLEKTPDSELQKMPCTEARKCEPQPRLELSL